MAAPAAADSTSTSFSSTSTSFSPPSASSPPALSRTSRIASKSSPSASKVLPERWDLARNHPNVRHFSYHFSGPISALSGTFGLNFTFTRISFYHPQDFHYEQSRPPRGLREYLVSSSQSTKGQPAPSLAATPKKASPC